MRTRNRRGMLLLVVLALLAIFAMLAVAFVVMTGSERGTSDKMKTIESQLDPPQKTLDAAVFDVVRGGPLSASGTFSACPIGSICLMEKIYGSDLTSGTINATGSNDLKPIAGGQLLTLSLPPTGNPAGYDAMHAVGCTVTIMSGSAAGLSTKIVGLMPPTQQGQAPSLVEMLPFEGNVMPEKGAQYIINGFPYGGAGFGYNNGSYGKPATGLLDAPGAYGPLALEPRNPANLNPPGGANCDYTAPDFQDPLLAYATAGTSGGVTVPIPSLHRADLIQHWIAANKGKPLPANQMRLLSYRPLGQNSQTSDPPDHPNFNGSNPNFDPTWDGTSGTSAFSQHPQWDVDNMGRGTPDSVWVDLGFPVRFTQDGRAYKPLFAILCLDLDGRLNVNAHGNLAQTKPDYYQPETLPYAGNSLQGDLPLPAPQAKYAGQVNAAQQQAQLIRGQGYGPAEINLAPLFSTSPTALASPLAVTPPPNINYGGYQALLLGTTIPVTGEVLGRYGEGAGTAGAGVTTVAGSSGYYAPLNWNRWFGYGESYSTNYYWANLLAGAPQDAYGSPPDTQGLSAIGLDVAGRPLYLSMGGFTMNAPYDIDLSRNAAHATGKTTPDSPFSVAELERVLRSPDRDSITLPSRLLALTATSAGSLSTSTLLLHPTELTTESYSVPVAPCVVPEPLRDKVPGDKRTRHPIDAAAAAMLAAGGTIDWGAVADLLPWEVLHGLKMNINRPFGAGARSFGGSMLTLPPSLPPWNLVEPDQPGLSSETVNLYASSGTKSEQFFYDGSGTLASDALANTDPASLSFSHSNSLAARQIYAKHLYVLMMMSADLAGIDAQTGSRENTARLIAQWAVNVVAYRDHNSIMIPFSYDVYPFGNGPGKAPGWKPDYTDQHTVWGCKRPELLITETLAFHDRRTEDTANEVPDNLNEALFGASHAPPRKPGKVGDPSPNKDPNFDQHFRPQGSLFVELYNPWTAMEAQSTDLLLDNTGKRMALNGVNLSQVTPGAVHSPVWRLIIVNPLDTRSARINGELRDPDDPDPSKRPYIERVVYFVPSGSVTLPADVLNTPTGRCFFASIGNNPTPQVVPPGGYAVIGSGESSATSKNRRQTLIGLDSTKQVDSRTGRYITLDPTSNLGGIARADTAGNTNYVLKNNTPAPPSGFTPSQPPATVVIDTPRRLSVSEPVGGYTPYEILPSGAAVTYNAASETYSDTIDIPFDLQRTLIKPTTPAAVAEVADAKRLKNDGTYASFRIIYLQRLADPTRQFPNSAQPTSGNLGAINAANPYRTVDSLPVDLTAFNGVVDAATNALDRDNTPGADPFRGAAAGQCGRRNRRVQSLEAGLHQQDQLGHKSRLLANRPLHQGTRQLARLSECAVSKIGHYHWPAGRDDRLSGRSARAVSLAELGLSSLRKRV